MAATDAAQDVVGLASQEWQLRKALLASANSSGRLAGLHCQSIGTKVDSDSFGSAKGGDSSRADAADVPRLSSWHAP